GAWGGGQGGGNADGAAVAPPEVGPQPAARARATASRRQRRIPELWIFPRVAPGRREKTIDGIVRSSAPSVPRSKTPPHAAARDRPRARETAGIVRSSG